MSLITNAKEARAAIGKTVYWEGWHGWEYQACSGTMEEVESTHVKINGLWGRLKIYQNLRTTKEL